MASNITDLHKRICTEEGEMGEGKWEDDEDDWLNRYEFLSFVAMGC